MHLVVYLVTPCLEIYYEDSSPTYGNTRVEEAFIAALSIMAKYWKLSKCWGVGD